MNTLTEQLSPYAERFSLEDVLSEYRIRCLEQKKAYLPKEKKLFFTLVLLFGFFLSLELCSQVFLRLYSPPLPLFSNFLDSHGFLLANQAFVWNRSTYPINTQHLRGKDIGPKTKTRLVCYGDSVTFGLGVEEDQHFSAQLAKKLPDFEVLNGGSPGWTLKNWHQNAKQIVSLKPDYVLLCLGWEDVIQLSLKLDWNQMPSHSILHHSAWLQMLQKISWTCSSHQTQQEKLLQLFLQRPSKKFHHQLVFQEHLRSLQEAVLFFQEQGISVFLMTLPHYFSHPEALEGAQVFKSIDLIRFSDWSFQNWTELFTLFNQQIQAFAKKESLVVLSFSTHFFHPSDFLDFRHLTEQGHQKIAEAIFQEGSSKKWPKIR